MWRLSTAQRRRMKCSAFGDCVVACSFLSATTASQFVVGDNKLRMYDSYRHTRRTHATDSQREHHGASVAVACPLLASKARLPPATTCPCHRPRRWTSPSLPRTTNQILSSATECVDRTRAGDVATLFPVIDRRRFSTKLSSCHTVTRLHPFNASANNTFRLNLLCFMTYFLAPISSIVSRVS